MNIELIKKIYYEIRFYFLKTIGFSIWLVLIIIFIAWYISFKFPLFKLNISLYFFSIKWFNFIINFIIYILLFLFIWLYFIFSINKKRQKYQGKNIFIPFANILSFRESDENFKDQTKKWFIKILLYNKLSIEWTVIETIKKLNEQWINDLVIWDKFLLPTKDAIMFYIKKYQIKNIYWLDFDIFWNIKIKSYYYDPFIININYALNKVNIIDNELILINSIENSLILLSIWKYDCSKSDCNNIIYLVVNKLASILNDKYIYFYLIHIVENTNYENILLKYILFIKSASVYFDNIISNLIDKNIKLANEDYNLFHLYGYSLFYSYKKYPHLFINEVKLFLWILNKIIWSDKYNLIGCIGRYWVHYLDNKEKFSSIIDNTFLLNEHKNIREIADLLNLTNKWHISFLLFLIDNNIINKNDIWNKLKSIISIIDVLLNNSNLDKEYKKITDTQFLKIKDNLKLLVEK